VHILITDCFYFVQGGYFPEVPPVNPAASSSKGKETVLAQSEAEVLNLNLTMDGDSVHEHFYIAYIY
jgi:hypothetical protein